MSIVDLEETEWQQVIAIITTAPWRDANPLLTKISQQLRAGGFAASAVRQGNSDDKEVKHE
jgi:hypothetical protein